MSSFWNWATGNNSNSNNSNSNYAMETDEPKPKTPRYGQKLETKAKPKPAHDDGSLIGSISETPHVTSRQSFKPANNSIRGADLHSSWFVTDNDSNPSTEQPKVAPRVTASGSYSKGADLNLHRFKGSRDYDDRAPFQDSLSARIPKSLKEADKIRKDAEKEADRIRKEAEKEAERLRKEADKEADRLRKEADKEADKIRKQAEAERERFRKQAERERSTPAYDFSSFRNNYANQNASSAKRANTNTSSHSYKPSDYEYKPSASSSNSNSNSSRNANSNSNSKPSASRTSGVDAKTSKLLEIIGFDQSTTEVTGENIKKAYKKMALKMHPDKNKDDPKATEKFQNFQTAYDKIKEKYNMSGGYSKKNKSQKRRRTNKKY
jgi:vacuolar-type H+-ATPase subunit H